MNHKPTVILTRPAGRNQYLADALHAQGYPTYQCPLFDIQPLAFTQADLTKIEQLDHYSGIIFTSVYAVAYGLPNIVRLWSSPPCAVATVGLTTGQALQDWTNDFIYPTNQHYSSEHLMAMPLFSSICGATFLLITGKAGRTVIQKTLRARGAHCDVVTCYTRCPREMSEQLFEYWRPLPIIICTSQSSLDILVQWCQKRQLRHWMDTPFVVISERLAQHARQHGIKLCVVAQTVTTQALVNAVNEAWRTFR